MSKSAQITAVVFLVAMLLGIRLFEDSLFYDPLLSFFKTDYSSRDLPDFDTVKLLLHLAFRFALNTLISLAILLVVFQNKGILKLSTVLYALIFIILIVIFYVVLMTSEGGEFMTLFYARRFLIQPIFLLILLPAFYFQTKKK